MKPPCEADLALDATDHERFGNAMLLCQDASGSCCHTGRCSYDGDCFHNDSIDYRKARRIIEEKIEELRNSGESMGVIVWLAQAKNAMEHYRNAGIG